MTYLWTTDDLLDATGGRPIATMPAGITGISIDSRTLAKGDAFFAIKGERFDGHDFASAAAAAGAGVLVVSEARIPALGHIKAPLIVVDDVLAALGRLAVAARARSRARVIAVTGSVGKTTTKAMLLHSLSVCGPTHAAVASFNNHWGVPLTLARMHEDARFGVFEIGMNHAGEITPLVKMVRPHVAIVTTIAAAHLGNFNSLDAIADAKAEIFSGVVSGGYAVLNRDNEKFARLEKAARKAGIERISSFGEHKRSNVRLLSFESLGETSALRADVAGEEIAVRLGVPGRHIADNALAVLAAAKHVGADLEKVGGAMATFSTGKGRGARHRLRVGAGEFTLIDESYNANPASMRAAIRLLADARPGEGGRRIAVLGDMLELGRFAEKLHGELAEPLQTANVDAVYMAGSEMKALAAVLPDAVDATYRETTAELIPDLIGKIRPGDVVMVKSSLGIGFGAVVSAILDNFPAVPEARSGDADVAGGDT